MTSNVTPSPQPASGAVQLTVTAFVLASKAASTLAGAGGTAMAASPHESHSVAESVAVVFLVVTDFGASAGSGLNLGRHGRL